MTVKTFLFLFTGFSILTSLVIEANRKLIRVQISDWAKGIIDCITALTVGCVGTTIFYVLNDIAFTTNNIIYMILLGLASALGSTVGYEKIKQSIEQFVGLRSNEVNINEQSKQCNSDSTERTGISGEEKQQSTGQQNS